MAQNETWLNHDMLEAVKVQYLDGNLFSMDNAGNLIGVKLSRNGEDYSGGGSVSANVIRADGSTVSVVGALSGNVATVVLPQAAYAVPGVASIVIKLTVSGEVATIAAVVANVYLSSTDSVVDPGTIIPSVQALISAIESAVASIPADYSALWTSLAPAFDSSANYVSGQYVSYNGGVYKFITPHHGSWNSSHVVAAILGNGIYDLFSITPPKYDVYKNIFNHADTDVVLDKSIDASGNLVANAGFYTTGYMPCVPGGQYRVNPSYTIAVVVYNSSKQFVEGHILTVAGAVFTVEAPSAAYIRCSGATSSIYTDMVLENAPDYPLYHYIPFGTHALSDSDIISVVRSYKTFEKSFVPYTGDDFVANVYNPATALPYVGINSSNGKLVTNANLYTSDLIPCGYGDRFKFRSDYTTVYVNLYGKEKNYLETISVNVSFTVANNNAYYFRFAGLYANMSTDMVIYQSATYPSSYYPFGLTRKGNALLTASQTAETLRNYSFLVHNIFNKTDRTDGYKISQYGEISADSDFYVSDYIPVACGDIVHVNPEYQTWVCMYDAGLNFLGSLLADKTYIIVDKTNAAYIRYTGYSWNAETDMVVKSTTYPAIYYSFNFSPQLVPKPWRGRNVITLGDSITYNKRYVDGVWYEQVGFQYYLKELGFSTVTNAGVSGACISYANSQYVDIVTTAQNTSFAGYDLVTIAGGTNDFYPFQRPIGELVTSGGTYDTTTVIGALQTIIEKILSDEPMARIAIFTPLRRFDADKKWYETNSRGYTLKDYRDAIVEVAQYYAIPVLDFFNTCNITALNYSSLTYDGLHPQNTGYRYICQYKLMNFIEGL